MSRLSYGVPLDAGPELARLPAVTEAAAPSPRPAVRP